jgi:hypothetical protein
VIKARFAAVVVACILSVFANRYVIDQARRQGDRTGISAWDDILGGWGEWELDVKQTFYALGLTALLFLGPLVEQLWIQEGWRYLWSTTKYLATSLTGWKIYVVVRPLGCVDFRVLRQRRSCFGAALYHCS